MTGHKRILIVDDDPKVLLILRTILDRMGDGYRIVAARDGTEAWELFDEDPFDLVVSDVKMPGIDGIELVEMIRAANTDTAVIWITAYGCHNLHTECKRLNVDHCLDKPLRIDEIRQVAMKAMGVDVI
ncbi:MAG: response regulator [Chloroflexota bacterium]|jgi:CheY-like chemotaxis protein